MQFFYSPLYIMDLKRYRSEIKDQKHFFYLLISLTHIVQNEGKKYVQQGVQQGVQYLKNNASQMMAQAPELAEEAPMTAMGMKKPRKKRQVSEREMQRHALIRSLMHEHGCSLAEASNVCSIIRNNSTNPF